MIRRVIALLAGATLAVGTVADESKTQDLPLTGPRGPLFEELTTPLPAHSYPGLPSANAPPEDPEQRRESLRRAVEQALAQAPELADSSILVHVTSLHRARLRGIVTGESQRLLAEIVAANVDGIDGVENGLRIETAGN